MEEPLDFKELSETWILRVCVCMCLFRATPAANEGSQARGRIGAIAAGLCHSHSHSNTGSKLHLQSTLQVMAMPDP